MIEVKNVSKKYGDFYVVRNINFDIQDGEIVGFLGRNGAGKTTTMNMLTGFIESTNGEIIVDGFDVDVKPKKVKELIGYMPEGVPLYPELTVQEFVSYMADLKLIPHKKKKEAVEKALKEAGLLKVKEKLTKTLSRGYKQRVSLAGALVGDPKILILDEPTVGLDPKQVIEIRSLIKSLKGKHTVILSSHILSEVSQICEKIIIIDKGEIIAIDTPENLEKNSKTNEVISITIDDKENKFENLIKDNNEIEKVQLINTKEDEVKTYNIILKLNATTDMRKELANICLENNILVLELKKEEKTLEDAFINLVENRKEYSKKEIAKMQYDKEIDEIRKEEEIKKELKENKNKEKEAEKELKKKQKEEKKKIKEQEKETKKNMKKGGDK